MIGLFPDGCIAVFFFPQCVSLWMDMDGYICEYIQKIIEENDTFFSG